VGVLVDKENLIVREREILIVVRIEFDMSKYKF